MKLAELKVGDKAKIIGYEKEKSSYRNQLLTMGLTPGTEITLTRIAPLGDPIQLSIRDFSLILRKNEAKELIIEKVSESV
jgi:ferrous iron transport protein A